MFAIKHHLRKAFGEIVSVIILAGDYQFAGGVYKAIFAIKFHRRKALGEGACPIILAGDCQFAGGIYKAMFAIKHHLRKAFGEVVCTIILAGNCQFAGGIYKAPFAIKLHHSKALGEGVCPIILAGDCQFAGGIFKAIFAGGLVKQWHKQSFCSTFFFVPVARFHAKDDCYNADCNKGDDGDESLVGSALSGIVVRAFFVILSGAKNLVFAVFIFLLSALTCVGSCHISVFLPSVTA